MSFDKNQSWTENPLENLLSVGFQGPKWFIAIPNGPPQLVQVSSPTPEVRCVIWQKRVWKQIWKFLLFFVVLIHPYGLKCIKGELFYQRPTIGFVFGRFRPFLEKGSLIFPLPFYKLYSVLPSL